MITSREQQIVMLSESGMSIDRIARQMNLAPAYVRGRVSYLCSGLGIDHSAHKAMAEGSERLRAAIEQARANARPGAQA